ncbi:superoxide dismutase [Cu-Zn] 2 isoform X2 [Hevea brasiliensis]|uniref:superoxide dismutase [Cu-Zn] 2 isoform X2 n=1 Tax=Hevea brasiliensis TaxID=3981 RepID=UPI0025D347B0|nr:superoxide dismutase [Cu-Zn] 2 isoform X2 [Hevea brasiliensis]
MAGAATATATGTVKAVALITGEPNVRGSLQFVQRPSGPTHVTGKITGLSPGLHGFHIHALGDTTNGCNSTGPHFNPLKKDHGAPADEERHAGDLGNIFAGSDGIAEISIKDMQVDMNLARLLVMLVRELDVASLEFNHLFRLTALVNQQLI